MRLSSTRTASLLALCGTTFLATFPSATTADRHNRNAESQFNVTGASLGNPMSSNTIVAKPLQVTVPGVFTTTTVHSVIVPTASIPPTTTSITTAVPAIPTVPSTTNSVTVTMTVPSTISTIPTTAVIVPTTAVTTTVPATTTSVPVPANTTCMSSADCPVNQLCALQTTVAVTGMCQAMAQNQVLCAADPAVTCVTSSDCIDPAFSYCATNKTESSICTGLGRPGTSTQCNSDGTSTGSSSSGSGSSLTTTLKYAGIAVGSVALLGILFALVRWRRNKSRSSIPDFSAIDYGMTNRRSEPRSSLGVTAAAAATGGQSYPFSSRPNARGANQTAAAGDQDGYYDEQYYDEGYAQQNAVPRAGGAAKEQSYYDQSYGQYDQNGYDQQAYAQQVYDQQGYGQQGYDQQYYKEGYNGYDQNGNYVGDGTYYEAGQMDNGYEAYSKDAVTDAPAVPQEALVRDGSRQKQLGGGAPMARTGDYAVDSYGVEPSEIDFGGQKPQSGYGRHF